MDATSPRAAPGAVAATEKIGATALTFDDVLLVPGPSRVLPRETNLATRFSRNVALSTPLVSAAMDTVTESAMAIAMARQGGIGVLHKRLPVETQVQMVRRVKRSESGMIHDPVTLGRDATVGDAQRLMSQYRISGVPIVEEDGRLVGILTNRDLRFEDDPAVSVAERMTHENLITVPEGTQLDHAQAILDRHKVEKLLVVDEAGHLTGLITIKDLIKRRQFPDSAKDARGRLRVAAAVGAADDPGERAAALVEAGVDALVLDSAHGHSQGVLDALEGLKARFDVDVVAGNVATADGARALVERGADAVKVGVGPGSICTTRVVTGVGMPQLTAILDAARVTLEAGVPLVADGGIPNTRDLPKALAAGADCVMAGSLLAGTTEAPGQEVLRDGRRFKTYRGMGSLGAMADGSADRYFQEDAPKFVPEGVEGLVPHKGAVADVVYQLVGGLRSAMGYCGTPDVPALQRDGRFVTVTEASLREGHPHDVTVTRDAPNYALSRR